jgi:hypothetical protein
MEKEGTVPEGQTQNYNNQVDEDDEHKYDDMLYIREDVYLTHTTTYSTITIK